MPVQPADAARPALCKDRSEIISVLSKRFNETQRSYGLQSDQRVLELYASPDGSWTALLTLPSGRSCVVAAGEAWTIVPPAPVGEPA
ncbi:MAG: hypothetical protein AAGD34_06045 [Pseudomonadota bacterium]